MTVSDPQSRLNPSQRSEHLGRMGREQLDLLVIGGGVTGCGVALDAVTRGLSVGLVEQRDFASGTSSRSSKLFHGGLRYLEQRNFKLVREALAERNLMIDRLCPHLVRPVSFMYPLRHRIWERAYVGAGVLLYDLLATVADSPLPRHRHLSRTGALLHSPALARSGLAGAVVYWDAVVDDARHTMTLARTAASHRALLASSTRVEDLITRNGRVVGASVTDLENGSAFQIDARVVINATGVWSDDVQAMAGDRGLDVLASKGVHILVPRDRVPGDTGLICRTASSVLFLIPWSSQHWIIGTTDTPWSLRRAHPAASRTDIEYLLAQVNSILITPLSGDDVVGVYAGLRPLLVGESDETSKLSREHAVLRSEGGLITITGGKYTTYRIMARDAVDAVLDDIDAKGRESHTHLIPLLGAGEQTPAGGDAESVRLHHRYGSLALEVRALGDQPSVGQGQLVDEAPYTRAEIAYSATHEGAMHLDDVLTRRTRISIETRDRGIKASLAAAPILAPLLGWNESAIDREIAHYRARVEAELDSQHQPDDRTADAARMGAADVRTGRSE